MNITRGEVANLEATPKPPVVLAVLLIVIGFLALTLQLVASMSIVGVLGWLVMFDGVVQLQQSIMMPNALSHVELDS